MLSNLQLGAQVKSATNDNLGKVKLVVADPKNNEVTHLIIEKGVLGTRQVVADRNLVRQVSDDGKTVWLTLSQAELDQLPDFIEHKTPYITPPGSLITRPRGWVLRPPRRPATPSRYLQPPARAWQSE